MRGVCTERNGTYDLRAHSCGSFRVYAQNVQERKTLEGVCSEAVFAWLGFAAQSFLGWFLSSERIGTYAERIGTYAERKEAGEGSRGMGCSGET
jgi:hypothetical protein